MKICAECKHYKYIDEYKVHDSFCTHLDSRDFVSGKPQKCYPVRLDENICGLEGKLFEPIVTNGVSN